MEKAYDVKELAKKLKDKGLDVAEDMAGHVYLAVKEWAKESAAVSENKIDDIVANFYDQLDPIILPQIDKIDGKIG